MSWQAICLDGVRFHIFRYRNPGYSTHRLSVFCTRQTANNGELVKGYRVLVTGAAGFLGAHACSRLDHLGANVIRLSRRVRGPHWVGCDLLNSSEVDELLERLRPELILHLAGSSRYRGVDGLRASIDANVVATTNLLMAVARHSPGIRVVTAGTLECANPWHEQPQFCSAYGVSKTMAELLARYLREQHGVDVVSARISMTYGPDDPNDFRLVPHVVSSLLQGRSPQLSSGERAEDWIYIDDVVEALIRIATSSQRLPPTIDVASGQIVSPRRVAETVRRCVGGDVPLVFGALQDPRGPQYQADIEQTSALLGWRAVVDLETGIARTVDWYRRKLAPSLATLPDAEAASEQVQSRPG